MATIRPLYKDYEYGWYGFVCSYNGVFMTSSSISLRKHEQYKSGFRSDYQFNMEHIMVQLSKLKGVVFIYGDYRDVI